MPPPVQEQPTAYKPSHNVIARSEATRQSRAGTTDCVQTFPQCHCEERSDAAIPCRNNRLRTNPPTMSLRGAKRRGNPVQELPTAYKPSHNVIARSEATRQSRAGTTDCVQTLPQCHCEERSDVAIPCRNYQVRANLQPEIATTSVRTGLAMTKKGSLRCHCEERSDVAISCRHSE